MSNTIRCDLLKWYNSIVATSKRAFSLNPDEFFDALIREGLYQGVEDTPVDVVREFQVQMHHLMVLVECLEHGQTILFSGEQADVFMDVTKEYTDRLDFRLPFQHVYLSFSSAVAVPCWMGDKWVEDEIIGLAISQAEVTADTIDSIKKLVADPYVLFAEAPNLEIGLMNAVHVIYKDRETTHFSWMSNADHELAVNPYGPVYESWINYKRLAIACIGYINCENVYLERQGEVPESVNRKRSAKGKSRLEPYYVCRIRGIQYDSATTGNGRKHGIRYDVRGHFRRLETGKTIWVRPHLRGLANELYVPKVYKISESSKPAFS